VTLLVNRQLVSQLGDPLPRHYQLHTVGSGHNRRLTVVHQLLPEPRVAACALISTSYAT
jgi:hypothetical protein